METLHDLDKLLPEHHLAEIGVQMGLRTCGVKYDSARLTIVVQALVDGNVESVELAAVQAMHREPAILIEKVSQAFRTLADKAKQAKPAELPVEPKPAAIQLPTVRQRRRMNL